MQESPHERDWIHMTGLVGLVVLLYVATQLHEPLLNMLQSGGRSISPRGWFMIVTAPAGWFGLVYTCLIRPDRITGTALAFVLALGVCSCILAPRWGISAFAISLPAPGYSSPPIGIVFLTGTWILNGLGILWVVHKVRRIRAASNTDVADAAR